MEKQLIFILLISFILLFSLISLASVQADEIRAPTGNEISPLARGESRGILMDPGTMYTLYYISDGKPATLQYSQPFFAYLLGKKNNERFVVAMSIYYAPWFDKKYTLVKNTGIDLFSQKTNLQQTQGVYKFEFKCYGCNWAAVNFKVLYK